MSVARENCGVLLTAQTPTQSLAVRVPPTRHILPGKEEEERAFRLQALQNSAYRTTLLSEPAIAATARPLLAVLSSQSHCFVRGFSCSQVCQTP